MKQMRQELTRDDFNKLQIQVNAITKQLEQEKDSRERSQRLQIQGEERWKAVQAQYQKIERELAHKNTELVKRNTMILQKDTLIQQKDSQLLEANTKIAELKHKLEILEIQKSEVGGASQASVVSSTDLINPARGSSYGASQEACEV